MSALEIDGNFETEVMQASVPVLADFNATWCGPCQQLAPVIDELAGEFEGKAKVVSIDVEKNMEAASTYGVMAVPTILLFHNGEVTKKWQGYTPSMKQEFTDAINGALA